MIKQLSEGQLAFSHSGKTSFWVALFILIPRKCKPRSLTCFPRSDWNTLFSMDGQRDVHWSVLRGSDVTDPHTLTHTDTAALEPGLHAGSAQLGGWNNALTKAALRVEIPLGRATRHSSLVCDVCRRSDSRTQKRVLSLQDISKLYIFNEVWSKAMYLQEV